MRLCFSNVKPTALITEFNFVIEVQVEAVAKEDRVATIKTIFPSVNVTINYDYNETLETENNTAVLQLYYLDSKLFLARYKKNMVDLHALYLHME